MRRARSAGSDTRLPRKVPIVVTDAGTLVGRMTARARWYLAIASARHLLTAAFALSVPHSFQSTSFIPIINVAPLWFWGIVFLGAGLACGSACLLRNELLARIGLTWSATSTAIVAAGLLISWATGDLSSPTGPIIWAAVALKDFTVQADPLRSPFEALAWRLEDHDEPRGG